MPITRKHEIVFDPIESLIRPKLADNQCKPYPQNTVKFVTSKSAMHKESIYITLLIGVNIAEHCMLPPGEAVKLLVDRANKIIRLVKKDEGTKLVQNTLMYRVYLALDVPQLFDVLIEQKHFKSVEAEHDFVDGFLNIKIPESIQI